MVLNLHGDFLLIEDLLKVDEKGEKCNIKYEEDARGNTINIFVMLPQYIVITMGEVMNSVTGLEFSYTQVRN